MNAIRRQRLCTLICAAIAVLALAGSTKATPVNSESLIADDIEYYIQTDKSLYALAEDVDILFRVTNLGDEQWSVAGVGSLMDIVIAAREGENLREVWFWHWYKGGSTGPVSLRLQPNESADITDVWPQIDYKWTPEIADDVQVPPGAYTISGLFPLTSTSVAVDVAVIPEPSSLILFATALAIFSRN
jgi:hypothetical protein